MDDIKKSLKIAFLTSLDPQDKRSWSGSLYYMTRALQKHCGDVFYVGPMNAPIEILIGKIMHRSTRLFFRKNFMYFHSALVAKRYAKIAAQRLARQSFDVIVTPAAATEIAFLKTDVPIVLIKDATYPLLHNYYPIFSNLHQRSFNELTLNEDLALKKARVLLYSSTWAARSAIEDYGADPAKIHVVPFGANLDEIPPREVVLAREKSERCRLLFLGVDWVRKGGDIAYETLLKLEEIGIEAELIVCGTTPPPGIAHERMKVIPFLDKNDEQQARAIEKLYATSDFLILPTRADCVPNVFREANAFGVPIITTDTGGVADAVRDGENGYVLPFEAQGKAYARVIAELYQDDQRYAEMVRASRAAFDERLNWDAWGIAVNKLITEMLEDKKIRMTSSPD